MTHPSEAKTFEEIEADLGKAAASGADVLNTKLEGDNIPDALKGKTVEELADRTKRLEDSLRVSETARTEGAGRMGQLEAENAALKVVQPSQKPVPDSKPVLTTEQLKDMYDKDPLAAIATMQQQANETMEANLAARMQPLTRNSADIAEQNARTKHAETFELFGDQVEGHLSKIPDRSVMSTAAAWDDLASYVRGQPGNLEKIIEHRASAGKKKTEEDALQAASDAAGASLTGGAQRPTPKTNVGVMDDTKREIAKIQGISEEDYLKWENMG